MLESEKIDSRFFVFSEKIYNLLSSVLFAADRAELVRKFCQAFVAGAMSAVEDAFFSLFAIEFFKANVALSTLLYRLF